MQPVGLEWVVGRDDAPGGWAVSSSLGDRAPQRVGARTAERGVLDHSLAVDQKDDHPSEVECLHRPSSRELTAGCQVPPARLEAGKQGAGVRRGVRVSSMIGVSRERNDCTSREATPVRLEDPFELIARIGGIGASPLRTRRIPRRGTDA